MQHSAIEQPILTAQYLSQSADHQNRRGSARTGLQRSQGLLGQHSDAYCWQYWKYSAAEISALPKEFLVSVLLINTERAYYNDSSAKPKFDTDLCLYHDHRSDVPRAACREARGVTSESDTEPDQPPEAPDA